MKISRRGSSPGSRVCIQIASMSAIGAWRAAPIVRSGNMHALRVDLHEHGLATIEGLLQAGFRLCRIHKGRVRLH